MTLTSSVTNALVVLIVVIVVFGVILGFAVSQNDLLNPKTSAASQRRIDEDTRHLTQVHHLEEQKQAKQDELEIEYNRQKAQLSLRLLPLRESAFAVAGAFGLLVVTSGTAILLVGLGYRWSGIAKSRDVWSSRAYRDARIQMARANERHLRQAVVPALVARDQSVSGDDGHRQKPIPLWRDHIATAA